MSKGEKLVSQAGALYNELYNNSDLVTIEGGDEVRVWKGSIVNTALSVGVPYGSYGAVVKALLYLGCIQQLQSGARNSPTVYVLHTEPTEELWANYDDHAAQALTKRARSATLVSEAERIIQSLGGADLGKVLKNHEDRITALEKQTAQSLKEGTNAKSKK
jgi:hypothetical protein